MIKGIWAGQKISVVIILLLTVTLTILYQRSVQTNIEDLYRMDAMIQALVSVDREMENDMVLLVSGRLTHFDSLTQGEHDIAKMYQALVDHLGETPPIAETLAGLKKALTKQAEPLDAFKRKLAIYRNSVRYLPTLLTQISQERPDKAKALMLLYREMLLMNTQATEFDAQPLKAYLQQLEGDEFQYVRIHFNTMLHAHIALEAAMFEFIHCGTDDAAEMLNKSYHAWFNAEVKSSDFFRLLLVIFSVLLLLYVAFVLWRLQQSARALKTSHGFLHYLQKAMDEHAIVAIANRRGDITYANPKFCEISGYSEEELLGQSHHIIRSGYHDPSFFTQMWTTIGQGKTWRGVIKNKKKNGEFYWVETTITPFLNEQGKPWQYIAVRTDITDRVNIEQALQESYEHYRLLSESIPEPLGLAQNGVWVYLNPAALDMFAASTEAKLLGQPVLDVVEPDSKANVAQSLGDAQSQHRTLPLQEVSLLTVGGKIFMAEIQGTPLTWEGKPAELLAMRDISLRKQEEAEHKAFTEQMEHNQRLESLGVLAGGIAHDFNNILTAILGNVSLAKMKVNQPSSVKGYLSKIQTASERAAELCQQMLMYSGGGAFEKKAISLPSLLSDVLEMTKINMSSRIAVEYIVADDVPCVEADSRQMQQIMLNLLTNAGEAVRGSGTVQVSLGEMDVDDAWLTHALNGAEIKTGGYVYFEVSDTGVGMDKETQSKIFDPFFTTKFTGRGLGMSAILGIIKAHDGAIAVHSSLGAGTVIRVVLPKSRNQVPVTQPHEMSADIQDGLKGAGTILVIDDEADILELAEAVFIDAGFEVLTALNGQEGVKVFDMHHKNIVAVVCDMVMPKLSGSEVATYIHAHSPKIKILISSGYDEQEATKLPEGVLSGFIHKPYAPATLVKSVFRALET